MAVTKLCSWWQPHVWAHESETSKIFATHLAGRHYTWNAGVLSRSVFGKRSSERFAWAVSDYPFRLQEEWRGWGGDGNLISAWQRQVRDSSGDLEDDDVSIEEFSIGGGNNGAGIFKVEDSNEVPKEAVKRLARRSEGPKWPLWLLGPMALLATGAVPALWLPTPSLFAGSAVAGILALTGLDGTFNMGSTVFLLAADTCARMSRNEGPSGVVTLHSKTPFGYKVWSMVVGVFGLLGPILAFAASWHGFLEPQASFLSSAAMIGPYALQLLVQMSVENLVWRWQSPVWPVVPLVYQGYRIFQLSRGIQLGLSLDAPPWLIQVAKGLVSWWVMVLGMQLMWIAWLTGSTRARSIKQSDPGEVSTFAVLDTAAGSLFRKRPSPLSWIGRDFWVSLLLRPWEQGSRKQGAIQLPQDMAGLSGLSRVLLYSSHRSEQVSMRKWQQHKKCWGSVL